MGSKLSNADYSENYCSAILQTNGDFLFLINSEKIKFNGQEHCDAILAEIDNQKKIKLYFIELKNASKTNKEEYEKLVHKIIDKGRHSMEIFNKRIKPSLEDLLNDRYNYFDKIFVIYLDEEFANFIVSKQHILEKTSVGTLKKLYKNISINSCGRKLDDPIILL
ncbi:MAG: hypothetical protein ACP5IB_08210 [Thermoplasmata archaeon]